MKLIVKLAQGNREAILAQLWDQGAEDVEVHETRTGVVVDLPQVEGQDGVFQMPSCVNGQPPLIQIAEEGGGLGEIGQATIICGFSGKALRPFFVGREQDDPHALFSVPGGIVVIELRLSSTGSRVRVQSREVVKDEAERLARIVAKTLYQGSLEAFPESLIRYRPAVDAALAKAQCQRCSHAHFIAES